MNFAGLFKALDAIAALRDATKPSTSEPPRDEAALSAHNRGQGLAGQIEARLTGVVIAALKEAFDRDHARLELERAQLEEQRRRADEALRLELRRQTADRELGRLRLLAGTALLGWLASVLMLGTRLASVTTSARVMLAVGWLLLLGALASAFTAQQRVGALVPDGEGALESGVAGAASLWLLMAGLAVTAISLLL